MFKRLNARRPTLRKNKNLRPFSPRIERLEPRALLDALPLGPMQGGTPNYYGPEPNWANSPLPIVGADGTVTGGLEKFVDSLPGLFIAPDPNNLLPGQTYEQARADAIAAADNNLGQYVSVAIPDTATYTGSDYYEIALVEYTVQMHSGLNPTTLRGYVQLETPANASISQHIQLFYPDGTPIDSDLNTPLVQPVFAFDTPQYLGATIVASKDTPVRIKFSNYLPTGEGGDLFIPVDTTMMGAGMGPNMVMTMMAAPTMDTTDDPRLVDFMTMMDPMLEVGSHLIVENFSPVAYNGEHRVASVWQTTDHMGMTEYHFTVMLDTVAPAATAFGQVMEAYTDSRATLHLHGGDNPWISDGTQHQWTTPAGEITNYDKGASVVNVPDMPDPGDGSITFFYPNQQSSRLMFYHDHAFGITRLNVYAGEAAGYVLLDDVEKALIADGTIPGVGIPLIVQDKTFMDLTTVTNAQGEQVPKILADDPTWPEQLDDSVSNLWYPHVYMPNQNPNVIDAVNPMGRWDYGPWIWPPFPVEHMPIYNVTNVLLTNAGSGYDPLNPPQVTISQPPQDGIGVPRTRELAIAEAIVDATGKLTAIDIIDQGSYEGKPVISIAPPPNGGTTATAIVETYVTPNLPDNSTGMESFFDTPMVNGTVYPYMEVDPTAYRFRVLNASNDRFFNLQLQVATSIISSIEVTNGGSGYTRAPRVVITDPTGTGAVATATVENGVVTGVNVLVVGSGYTNPTVTFVGGLGAGGVAAAADAIVYNSPTEVGMVPFGAFQPDYEPWPAGWPTPDGRDGGIPDPRNLGPEMIQIGTEGGFLPTPVVLNNTPMGWDRDPKSATVGNVLEHNLFLGCAERADVIVDFSKFAGQTLLLYNDAPAAVPASDSRYDYYTNNGDQTDVGGTPSTLPGYGPNTRTVMQIRVKGDPTIAYPAYDVAKLMDAFTTTLDEQGNVVKPSVFLASQEPIIVPQADYNSAYGLSGVGADTFPSLTTAYERIESRSMVFQPLDLTTDGKPADRTNVAVTIDNSAKAIIEEWSTVWGRMQGFLGLEQVYTASLNQTSLWFTIQDPVTEILADTGHVGDLLSSAPDGTQIWRITHNGVDTHPIHFHLFNVQIINRVDWAGVVKPPEANELGWKDTVRMNPLEDCIVALRPKAPELNFGLPDSIRLLDPTSPVGSTMGFQVFDANGEPATVVNDYYNFGWEYVWHCHILSHEEMDMMRPMQLNVGRNLAAAPVLGGSLAGTYIALNWTDGTPVGDPTTMGNPANEVGYRIERAQIVNGQPGTYIKVGTAPANSTSYTDITANPHWRYSYRVVAFNAAGDSVSNGVELSVGMPEVTGFIRYVNQDTALSFAATDFTSHFTDVDAADSLQSVQIVSLPTHGTLQLGGVPVVAGEEIVAASLGDLAYLPAVGYVGSDSFAWDASDGTFYSGLPTTATLIVDAANGDIVTEWNRLVLSLNIGHAQMAGRAQAMMHTAMYDTLMAFQATHSPYYVTASAPAGASMEAAATAAAYQVLYSAFTAPDQRAMIQARYDDHLAEIIDGQAETDGIAFGQSIAQSILALRANDGAMMAMPMPYPDGTLPGEWRRTASGEPMAPGWGEVTPWAMTGGNQFDQGGPPALDSAEYLANYEETRTWGSADSTLRSADQTASVMFWMDHPQPKWYAVAREISELEGLTLIENARLFALLSVTMADATISAWDMKYNYSFWRPETAIHLGDVDGNDTTVGDPAWQSLIPAPAFPEYVSGHSLTSAAAATVLGSYFGKEDYTFQLTSMATPGPRTYNSFWQAVEECGSSRVFGGIHFSFSNQDAYQAGSQLGQFVYSTVAINHPPVVTSFAKTADGGLLEFVAADFTANFTDPDALNTLQTVQIVSLPTHGALHLTGILVVAGQEVPLAELANLSYEADAGYVGADSFTWDGSDGVVYSGTPATISLMVIAPPSVTIDQAIAQADPTSQSPIHFTVVFSTAMTGFDGADVTLTGTAGATMATVSTTDNITFDVIVEGMTADGFVTVSIPAGAAHNSMGTANTASTSTDNTVLYNHAPILANGTLAAVLEDTANPLGAVINQVFAGRFLDFGTGSSLTGIVVLGNPSPATEGVWQYSSDALNWADIGNVGAGSALALSHTSAIRFLPAPDFNGVPAPLSVRGLDFTYGAGFSSFDGMSESRVVVDATNVGGATPFSEPPATISTAVTAVNDPPQAVAGSLLPYAVDEGGTVTLDASASTDVDLPNDALTFAWDFNGDGQYDDAVGPQPVFSAAGLDGPATAAVSLLVTDAGGLWSAASATISITNLPPVIVTASQDGPVDEGSPATVTITATDPAGVNDPLTYEFDFDSDGTYEVMGSGPSAQHTFADNGTYAVGVRVSDDDGGSATSIVPVVIDNVAPSIQAVTNDGPADEGWTITVTVTASDPAGAADPLTYAFDFNGDGIYELTGGVSEFQYAFPDNGLYVVGVLVTDGDGGQATSSTTVTVYNVAPTASLSNNGPVYEGSSAAVTFSGQTDPSVADIAAGFHYAYDFNNDGTFDLGDGTYDGSSASASAIVPPEYLTGVAARTVGARIVDKDGGFSTANTTIDVIHPAALIDNDDPGFSRLAGTWYYNGQDARYYGHDHRYAMAGTGAAKAQWDFGGLAEGASYQLAVTWLADANRATNALYKVLVGGQETSIRINQRVAPNDLIDASGAWEELLTVAVPVDPDPDNVGSLQVQLWNDANGYVIADAVRADRLFRQEIQVSVDGVVLSDGQSTVDFKTALLGAPMSKEFVVTNLGPLPLTLSDVISVPAGFTVSQGIAPTAIVASGASATFRIQMDDAPGTYSGEVSLVNDDPTENPFNFTITGQVATRRIIDNGQPGFAIQGGTWRAGATNAGYYRSTHHYQSPTTNPAFKVAWTFQDLQPGVYEVSATWLEAGNRANNVVYTVTSGTTTTPWTGSQRLAPAGIGVPGDDPVNPAKAVKWQTLAGSFTVLDTAAVTETLTVTLAGAPTGYVIADAVRIKYLSSLAPLTADFQPSTLNAARLGQPLTLDVLSPIVSEATVRWEATGLDAGQLSLLQQAQYVIADLGGRTLALAAPATRTIYLDDNAAGNGWFIDQTPATDAEFSLGQVSPPPASLATSRVDLLTAVMHEMGHLLGKPDVETATNDLMSSSLATGVRRGPTSLDIRDALFATGQD